MSNERLDALAAAGVSIWLDDLSRERLRSGNLQSLITDSAVVGVTTNPTIFAAALANGEAYDAAGPRARAARRLDRRRGPRDHRGRRGAGLRRVPRDLGRHQRGGRAGLARGRPAAGPRHRRHRRPGAGPVEGRGPAEPAGQDPGHRGRPAGDHPGAVRGRLGERDADLLGGALPDGDGRLPGRPGAGRGQRAPAGRDRLGGQLLRVPGGLRDRQAAGEDRHRRGAGAARAGRDRQLAAGLRGLPGGLLRRAVGRAGRQGRQAAAAAVGLDRGEEPGVLRHHVRHRAGRRRHREHDAGEDPAGLRRPR